MGDVTRILADIEQGDPRAVEQLLPLVYDELRKLAAQKMAQENPGQTLQATALVHDAYLRLVDVEKAQHWNSRGHFFAAAAEVMRRILIEQARRRKAAKRGGQAQREELHESVIAVGRQRRTARRGRPAGCGLSRTRCQRDGGVQLRTVHLRLRRRADDCNGTCTFLGWDSDNCGACGNVCAPLEVCNFGSCEGYCIGC
jgi:hypothetical protein